VGGLVTDHVAPATVAEVLLDPASYSSCSHGAGRRMSRNEARKTLDVETFRSEMGERTWQGDQAKSLLDEDPRAYKDIDQVMADQDDLVTVEHRLTQILNYKGL
jgi:tRNA-splicing ligase RtcB